MKRSEINQIMQAADAFIRDHHFYLPPFAYWTPEDWQRKGPEARGIVDNQLGWDITDFGGGDFHKRGLFLFTIRNGRPENLKAGTGKTYAEKIMIVDVDQETPYHFHWLKMEDIINRGGGQLALQLFNATPSEDLDTTSDVRLSMDEVERVIPAGGTVTLSPGESITLPPYCYHRFWGTGEKVLVGEVSQVNDDQVDNRFHAAGGRFPSIDEDEAPLHLLVTDYERYYYPQK